MVSGKHQCAPIKIEEFRVLRIGRFWQRHLGQPFLWIRVDGGALLLEGRGWIYRRGSRGRLRRWNQRREETPLLISHAEIESARRYAHKQQEDKETHHDRAGSRLTFGRSWHR